MLTSILYNLSARTSGQSKTRNALFVALYIYAICISVLGHLISLISIDEAVKTTLVKSIAQMVFP